ncbi:MAG TPA: 50S ribosomal protein L15 [Pirellulaceae bacterium]|nr:50S ribosomal protein L15 [Pirellulaceae bacterium]HMO92189.1 50S ribosomal protein L15 [Pirellulaceae bacterium]HMP68884.1 50S ribosomal protein L15 [Pirellulaceae bacterium]
MNLHDVNEGIEKYKKRKRIGRGIGSGTGKTSARGHKGQRSRAGASRHPAFQGGAMPMIRRIPKRGFTNKFALTVAAVNVSELESNFENGDSVTPESLLARNLANFRFDVLKILGNGKLTKKLKVTAHRFSTSAREKINQAGGEIIEIPGKKPVVKNKQKSAKK